MHPAKLLLALAVLAILPLTVSAETAPEGVPVPGGTLPGHYMVNGDSAALLIIEPIDARNFRLQRPGVWEGVGVFDGRVLWGAFRYAADAAEGHLAGCTGGFRALAGPDGSFEVQGAFVHGWSGRFTGIWERMADLPQPAAAPVVQPEVAPAVPPETKSDAKP